MEDPHLLALKKIERSASKGTKRLELRIGSLKTLPKEVFELEHLTSLDLKGSGISELPPELGRLHKLRYLVLTHMQVLQKLPKEIGELQDLSELSFNGSPFLTHLPDEIGNLKKLKKLTVLNSGLKALPNTLNGLESLLELNLPHSKA